MNGAANFIEVFRHPLEEMPHETLPLGLDILPLSLSTTSGMGLKTIAVFKIKPAVLPLEERLVRRN